ncbi:MAG: hypothetical protein GY835_19850, partial [bacterium]|nr:hypothetical protein [bacterium]
MKTAEGQDGLTTFHGAGPVASRGPACQQAALPRTETPTEPRRAWFQLRLPERQFFEILFAPIPELNTPPNLDPNQIHGLRALRAVGREIKLIYGLRALEPLAEHGPAAIATALTLVTEILSVLGAFLSRNPDTSLADLRAAAVSTLLDLRPGHEPVPDADVEPFRSPQVVFLEAAEMAQL